MPLFRACALWLVMAKCLRVSMPLLSLLVYTANAVGANGETLADTVSDSDSVNAEAVPLCPPSRILMVPVGGSSHIVFHGSIGNELRRRGHTVAIATDGGSKFVVKRVRQTGLPFYEISDFTFSMITDPILEDSSTQDENFGQALWAYWNVTYKQGLKNLRTVIAAFKPDFMIVDNYRAEALDAAQEASIPYAVTFNMFGYLGLESAPYAPASPMPFSVHDTSFTSRFIQRVVAPLIFRWQVLPMMRELNNYRRDMGVTDVWDVREQLWGHLTIYKGFFGFEHPIPVSPFAVLAGMPLNPTKTPMSEDDKDLMKWLDNGQQEEFVIYAALGSIVFVKAEEFLTIVEAVSMVKNARLVFAIRKPLQAHMSETNLKRARDFFAGRPNAFRIDAWVNQDAVLCHKNVRVFISHAGKQSLAEAMDCGKPVLGVPFVVDQPANALRVQDAGMGLYVDRLTTTAADIAAKIEQLVYDERFVRGTRRLNQLRLRTNGVSHAADAIETVLVMGEDHLRTADLHLSPVVAFNIDVYCAAALTIVLVIGMVLFLIRVLLRSCKKSDHKKVE